MITPPRGSRLTDNIGGRRCQLANPASVLAFHHDPTPAAAYLVMALLLVVLVAIVVYLFRQ